MRKATVSVVVFAAATAWGGFTFATRVDGGTKPDGMGIVKPVPLEPMNHHSYVRDANMNLVGRDDVFAGLVAANSFGRYSEFDIVMQQCFGGGFLEDFNNLNKDHTFTSATAWSEAAWSTDDGTFNGNNRSVDNFTRSWRDALDKTPPTNYLEAYKTAAGFAGGKANVAQDPFARNSTRPPAEERPQYNSIGMGADQRTPSHELPGQGLSRQYAILAIWDKADERHYINVARVYKTLTTTYGVPVQNIVVLSDVPGGINIGGAVDGEILPGIPAANVQLNTKANLEAAIKGAFFGMGMNQQPSATKLDELLLYNTGHGGHTNIIDKGVVDAWNGGMVKDDVRYKVPVSDNDTFELGKNVLPSQGTRKGIEGIPGKPNFDGLQLIFREKLIGTDLTLRINGPGMDHEYDLDAAILAANDPKIVHVEDLIAGGPFFYYDFEVPASVLSDLVVDPNSIVFDLLDLAAGQRRETILTALVLRGGDQEYMAVVVPEPGMMGVLALGGLLLTRRRAA